MNKKLALDLILEYILQSEEQDFEENPSKGHVYYLAIYLKYGAKTAKTLLKLQLNALENEVFNETN